MIFAWAVLLAGVCIAFAVLIVGKGSDGQDAMRGHRRRALAAAGHEHAREALLERWGGGFRSHAPLEFAEGRCYVTGAGIDNDWVEGLMQSDDRIRSWNGQPPRGFALSRRRD